MAMLLRFKLLDDVTCVFSINRTKATTDRKVDDGPATFFIIQQFYECSFFPELSRSWAHLSPRSFTHLLGLVLTATWPSCSNALFSQRLWGVSQK